MGKEVLICSFALSASVTLCGCGSSGSASIPLGNWEKEAALVASSTLTPEHSLPKIEYPFDEDGNYLADWAARGEVRFRNGSSQYASSSTQRSYSAAKPKPTVTRSTPAPQKSSFRYHKVTASDTLWSLSRKYGTTVAAIQKANGLSSSLIITGSTIKIPG